MYHGVSFIAIDLDVYIQSDRNRQADRQKDRSTYRYSDIDMIVWRQGTGTVWYFVGSNPARREVWDDLLDKQQN